VQSQGQQPREYGTTTMNLFRSTTTTPITTSISRAPIQLEKICLVCVAVLGYCGLSPALNANTITVTNTHDSGPGSLRHALPVAINGETINATSVSGTILLKSGPLQITHNVHIHGPGAGNLAVNGNATVTVFENVAPDVTISGFTITNGKGGSAGGGGILNLGGQGQGQPRLPLQNSRFVSNATRGLRNSPPTTTPPSPPYRNST